MIGRSGGVYELHALLPEWLSLVVDNGPRPRVVTCLHNKLAFAHQPIQAPSLPYRKPVRCRQTRCRPPWAWTSWVAKIDTYSAARKQKHTPRFIQIPSSCSTIERRVYTYLLTERRIGSEHQSSLSTFRPLWDFEVVVDC